MPGDRVIGWVAALAVDAVDGPAGDGEDEPAAEGEYVPVGTPAPDPAV
ncbi:hypothetical protein FMEAI12_3050001 [Parafrankia sp. Ea1.12]|nr:hypothetical protein FMEAI12_3050001 [Parafrankia sp. Ea1.12]